jgi:putative flippase GtrA
MHGDENDTTMRVVDTTSRAHVHTVGAQAARFVAVGGTSYLINLGLYSLGILLGLHYLAAATVAFCIGFAFNFLTNRSWTFQASHGQLGRQFIRFVIVAGTILMLDLLLLRLTVGELGAPRIPAQAVIVLLLAPLSFTLNRRWSFHHRRETG